MGLIVITGRPLTCFFSSPGQGFDGLALGLASDPHVLEETGHRSAHKTSAAAYLYRENYGLPALLLSIRCQLSIPKVRVCSCDADVNVLSCSSEAYTLPASLSRRALIAILACILVLLVMILLMLSLRSHRKKLYLTEEEENVHENIVRYDDEGGGEEDTEAFDIARSGTLARQDMQPEIQTLSRHVPQAPLLPPASLALADGGGCSVHGYVLAKLYEADLDPCAPPYDSLQTYAYEGEGSVADSLSSLQSAASHADHDYDYLSEWGPRFYKLAQMYGAVDEHAGP
ncbi:cadherin-20-like [Engraulis encrasicolus]|uniref:cadherin-20-like n=1 Tax=Engraulis encrasicolus TaxID=184585 RepID=UPI002FD399D3